MELDTKLRDNFGSGIRNRIFFYFIISLINTFIVEAFMFYNFKLVAEYMSEVEYVNTGYIAEPQIAEWQVAVMIILGIIVFMASFMLLIENIISYINEMTKSVRRIAAGDLNEVIAVRGNDELAYIATSLNDMTDKLLVLMEKERDSERSKNELITNVAHDLRTPLTSIIGYMGYLTTKKDLKEEERENYIQMVYSKAKRLEKLIEDLFSFTKLSHGKLAMKVGKVDIVMLTNQLLDDFYPSFEKEGLECELICKKSSILINADGNLIARLFDNLINNAIKYGKEGKYIRIFIEENEETVVVSVVNYGYVIPKEDIGKLFNKFFRVEQSRSTNTGGTGLGLAIVKNIVDMHKGNIEVRSDLNGTEFIVTLLKEFNVEEEVFGA
ncbi:MAG: HAMP domain-containing histidine kinase [Lachnospiraceae bacterium]|nr:HAMP domain-containing histidine kinase [Lachnospiraceae bacterium]